MTLQSQMTAASPWSRLRIWMCRSSRTRHDRQAEALLIRCGLKVAAVAITIGGRMGGGVFSPSLMVGALTGRHDFVDFIMPESGDARGIEKVAMGSSLSSSLRLLRDAMIT